MISRVALSVGAALVGIVVGAVLVLATASAPGAATRDADPSSPGRIAVGPNATPDLVDEELPHTAGSLLLAWTAGGLPDGFATAVSDIAGVTHAAEVVAGRLDLTSSWDGTGTVVDQPAAGWAIAIDAIAVDPTAFSDIIPTGQRPILERLAPGSVILGATSAAVRGLGVGGQLALGGSTNHTVVGVLEDAAIGAAEVVLHHADLLAADMSPRYVLLRHDDERPVIEAALGEAAGQRPLRVRALGETPFLRHGDAVLPQALVKRLYGEFHYRPPGPGVQSFEIDPAWVAEHIVTRDVPILGSISCHRLAIESLEDILRTLDQRGLAHTIDPDGYAGCWNPRLISEGGNLSRHAWGMAIDVNAKGNPTGTGSGQHDALVALFTTSGWGWGGTWLVPDPMHFELVADPASTIKVRP